MKSTDIIKGHTYEGGKSNSQRTVLSLGARVQWSSGGKESATSLASFARWARRDITTDEPAEEVEESALAFVPRADVVLVDANGMAVDPPGLPHPTHATDRPSFARQSFRQYNGMEPWRIFGRRGGEQRLVALGMLEDMVVAIVFTEADQDLIRLISMRRATRNEQRIYFKKLPD
jgi:hypothetical protein